MRCLRKSKRASKGIERSPPAARRLALQGLCGTAASQGRAGRHSGVPSVVARPLTVVRPGPSALAVAPPRPARARSADPWFPLGVRTGSVKRANERKRSHPIRRALYSWGFVGPRIGRGSGGGSEELVVPIGGAGAVLPRTPKGAVGPLSNLIRRRPTLPGGCPPSTIGAGGLNCSVRNGKRCFPAAMTAGNL
jgi:hypothetical protein